MAQTPEQPRRGIPSEKGIELLNQLVTKGKALRESGYTSDDDHQSWEERARDLLERLFGPGSSYLHFLTVASGHELNWDWTRRDYERINAESIRKQIRAIPRASCGALSFALCCR